MTEQADAGMDTPKSLREYITNTVINTVPPLIAYYVLRVFDFEPYLALVGAIITAAAQGALTMVRKRKVEPANVVVIVGAVCSLTIALTTKNPRIVQALELVPMSLLVWSFAVSGLLRKPNSKKVAGVISPALADAVRDNAVKKGNAKEVASYEQRGVLYREGFIDDHERPIESILTPLKAAIAKCEGLHRSSGKVKP